MIDVRAILAVPTAYRLLGRIIGGNGRETYAREYLRVHPGDRVLDIGCGPGDILSYLPGGRFVTLDGCFTNDQSWIARRMLKADRGEHVREEPAYISLAKQAFSDVHSVVHHNLLRVPYTHIILTCTRTAREV